MLPVKDLKAYASEYNSTSTIVALAKEVLEKKKVLGDGGFFLCLFLMNHNAFPGVGGLVKDGKGLISLQCVTLFTFTWQIHQGGV